MKHRRKTAASAGNRKTPTKSQGVEVSGTRVRDTELRATDPLEAVL